MTEQPSATLTSEQITTLWEVAGKPTDLLMLETMLGQATPQTAVDFLSSLRQQTQVELAQNPNSTAPMLAHLSQIDSAEVQEAVIRNPHTTDDTRRWIFSVGVSSRFYDASRLSATPEELDTLAHDPNASVREQVAEHRNALPETLARLATDTNARVRQAVQDHDLIDINRGGESVDEEADSADLETEFSEDFDYENWLEVATNPHTPVETLRRLAVLAEEEGHPEAYGETCIIGGIARNPATPTDLLETIDCSVQDTFCETCLRGISANPTTSAEILQEIALGGFTDTFPIVNEMMVFTVRNLVRHPNTPPEVRTYMSAAYLADSGDLSLCRRIFLDEQNDDGIRAEMEEGFDHVTEWSYDEWMEFDPDCETKSNYGKTIP